jgi:ribosome-associated heat shock protein Hsp15
MTEAEADGVSDGHGEPGPAQQRLDKWLWCARFFKTRSLAQQAIELGRVRSSGNRVKPAHGTRVGDTLEILAGETRYEIIVRALSGQRGPAPMARTLYEETAASRAQREQTVLMRRHGAEPAQSIKGRPTKREGRALRRLRAQADR